MVLRKKLNNYIKRSDNNKVLLLLGWNKNSWAFRHMKMSKLQRYLKGWCSAGTLPFEQNLKELEKMQAESRNCAH